MKDAESVKGSVLGNDGRKGMGGVLRNPSWCIALRICRLGNFPGGPVALFIHFRMYVFNRHFKIGSFFDLGFN